jgi:hypothetical protein
MHEAGYTAIKRGIKFAGRNGRQVVTIIVCCSLITASCLIFYLSFMVIYFVSFMVTTV